MTDVLRIALNRRDELNREVGKLDDFIRMAESLIRADQTQRTTPAVDPLQARFNSGEVLPPAPSDREAPGSSDAARPGVFRRGSAPAA